jgi:hypothetical protein
VDSERIKPALALRRVAAPHQAAAERLTDLPSLWGRNSPRDPNEGNRRRPWSSFSANAREDRRLPGQLDTFAAGADSDSWRPVTASLISASVNGAAQFRSGRHFAAWIGLGD